MNALRATMFTLIALTFPAMGEGLENGDFSSDLNYWNLNRSNLYGTTTKARIDDGALHLSGLSPTRGSYLSLSQAVDIKEGKTYKLSFDVMGGDDQQIGVVMGDSRTGKSSSKRVTISGSSWNPVSVELKAKCSTDSSWYKNALKLVKKNKLNKKGTTSMDNKEKKKKKDGPKSPGACSFRLALGKLDGQVAFRNFSLTEVE